MDDDGFIPVTLIASFHRVRNLTVDLNKILAAIKSSDQLELIDNFKASMFSNISLLPSQTLSWFQLA